jgi:hypothetical protein
VTDAAEPIVNFEEVGELLDKQADALAVVMHGYGPPWAEGSRAAAECAFDEGMEGTPYLTTALLVSLYLGHALDHLRASANLAGDLKVVMSSYTLVRPILGSASRAMWLLTPETATERLRRGLNLQLVSLAELENITVDRDAGVAKDVVAAHRPVVERFKRNAVVAGLPGLTAAAVRPDGTRKAHRFGHPVPSDMQLIRELLDRNGRAPTGDLVFRVSSAFVHGQHHVVSLMSRQFQQARSAPGVSAVSLGFRLDNFVTYTASAVIGVHEAALAAVRYAGLPDEVWQNLMQPLMRRWQASLHVARNTAFRDLTEPVA